MKKSKLKLRSMVKDSEMTQETMAKFVALLINEKKGYEYVKYNKK